MTTTAPRKKLIEVSIPLEAINVASAREQDNPFWKGHPRGLHPWWARRPLAACRSVIFAQLVDDPSACPDEFPTELSQELERKRLHKLMAHLAPWEASTNETILADARWEIARSLSRSVSAQLPDRANRLAVINYIQQHAPVVIDPFCGRGSIPLEAQRLGLRAVGGDINPVAVLMSKALTEFPAKFSGREPINEDFRSAKQRGGSWKGKGADGLADDVQYYANLILRLAKDKIGRHFPAVELPGGKTAPVVAWLWARTVKSPDPAARGKQVPLISTFILSNRPGREVWLSPILSDDHPNGIRFKVNFGAIPTDILETTKKGTKSGRGANFSCILTGATIDSGYVKEQGKTVGLGKMLVAIVSEDHSGKIYLPADETHVKAADIQGGWMPEQIISSNTRWFAPPDYGYSSFGDLFSARQLLALNHFSDSIHSIHTDIAKTAVLAGFEDDATRLHNGGVGSVAYADAICTYLGLLLSKSIDYNCEYVTWNVTNQNFTHLFTAQNIPFIADFAEANPFAGGVSFCDFAKSLREILQRLPCIAGTVIELRDARTARNREQSYIVCTDPPYFENISYADLADIFYVWQARMLKQFWPDLYRTIVVNKEPEIVAEPVRYGGKAAAAKSFAEGMQQAIASTAQVANGNPITMFYAYKQSESDDEGIFSAGWAGFLQGLVDAGLTVEGTWPLRTERSARKIGLGTNALASSIVLVCRKRDTQPEVVTRADLVRTLKRELPHAIDDIRKAGVGPVDMQQSVIGPGMGVFSRYEKVLEDDDSAMLVKTALSLINRVWEEIDQELDAAFDAETQVALAWFATFGFDAKPSGELITLANAKNIGTSALFDSGVFKDLKGKTALTPREELPKGWTPASDKTLTVWECVQHTARVLNAEDGGGAAAARLVAQMGAKAAEARALAYRLFEIATQKGWSAEALIYNELAQEWPKLEDLASSIEIRTTTATAQAELF
jgi:putative DNA methylase